MNITCHRDPSSPYTDLALLPSLEEICIPQVEFKKLSNGNNIYQYPVLCQSTAESDFDVNQVKGLPEGCHFRKEYSLLFLLVSLYIHNIIFADDSERGGTHGAFLHHN